MIKKCVIWDLDNTLWKGILSEYPNVEINNEVLKVIKELDKRGILNSVASKNNYEDAMDKLKSFGIEEYFLYPQISWRNKSSVVKQITELLNIGIDSIAFVDDQIFEREEVASVLPEVMCIDISDIGKMLTMDEFIPRFITSDSANRRKMYQADMVRKKTEEGYEGPSDEFLISLKLRMKITKATKEDLKRVEELTIRTHQLNTTGYTYSYEQLNDMLYDDKYTILVAELDDKYGGYGKIGIALLENGKEQMVIKLFLMSCRVMSRGVGNIFIGYLMNQANCNNKELVAEFVETDRNRIMYMTYRFLGFREIKKTGAEILLKWQKTKDIKKADYVELFIE